MVTCPRFVLVNGSLEPPTYHIKDGDRIEVCNYYTVAQLAEFMDVEIDTDQEILVNNREESMDAQIYENFSVDWTVLSYRTAKADMTAQPEAAADEKTEETQPDAENGQEAPVEGGSSGKTEETTEEVAPETEAQEEKKEPVDRSVFVNGELIVMHGKPEYVFIDVFDYIDFDLSDSRGRAIVTTVNDKNAFYTQTLDEGDEIVIRWEES